MDGDQLTSSPTYELTDNIYYSAQQLRSKYLLMEIY